jgi:hypothetical protein
MSEEARERIIIRREPVVEKTCPICGRVFPALNRQTYCTVNCANKASYQRNLEKRKATRRRRYREQQQATQDPA